MSVPKTIIVTGANRGIGQAICTLLLANPAHGPLKLFATSRKGDPLGFTIRDTAAQEIIYPALDVSEPDSIADFADRVRRESDGGKVSVLINNAGVYQENSGEDAAGRAKQTLKVNYLGTRKMCEQFIPHMASTGRIVNMSSVASHLRDYSDAIRQRFRNPAMTFAELDQLVQEYIASLQQTPSSSSSPFGPANRAYNFSKSCVNVTTRIFAAQNPQLAMNCCCPGWVRTDMGLQVGRSPPKTPEEGSTIPLRLAFGEIGGVSGAYWANESPRSREEGKVREWGQDGDFVNS